MNTVAISQRVLINQAYPERRDALAQDWYPFLRACELVPLLVPNDPVTALSLIEGVKISGIILSGGNDLAVYGGDAPERDETEKILLDFSKKRELPVLGVCRGAQFMNVSAGGTLRKCEGHVALRHILDNGKMVNSYHQYALDQLAPDFDVLASCAIDGTAEFIKHSVYKWIGIMWHPERESVIDQSDINLVRELFGL